MLRPQRASRAVSVQMGHVFFVSVQRSWSLNTSGRSQAKTLGDKPTLKLLPHLYACYAASFNSITKKGLREPEHTLFGFWMLDWQKVPPRPELRMLVGVVSVEVVWT